MGNHEQHINESLENILKEVRELQKKDYVTKEVNELSLKNLEDNINNIKENYTKISVFWKWIVCGGLLITFINILIHFLSHSK